ncbi:enoyl-CoA hydratase/isomerase family protein [Toxoplasma gondii TgCatPRC2]|uniref:Enoyl-CoA hydratase/isomerase family protein n=1 Tax=Toxoplasma gondii TgCatPRC2 TaxID=1130821 RepID=A0A151HKV6_TOXGO|nr:enoyl-CoA hydratase/isomerase family protein [Toxoplasma gondii TgCatPRC2]
MDDEKTLKSFGTLRVTRLAFPESSTYAASQLSFVYEVCLNRPGTRNAFGETFWCEFRECFVILDRLPSCRCVLITAEGSVFTAGIDLAFAAQVMSNPPLPVARHRQEAPFSDELPRSSKSGLSVEGGDTGGDSSERENHDCARKSAHLRRYIMTLQDSFSAVEECSKPVIVCVGGPCVGAGVDLICSCDIRLVSKEAWFSVKEVDIGIAADVGTLQRLPRVVGNDAWVREVCFTGRRFGAEEARRAGLVSELFENREEMRQKGMALACDIAAKSPVAVSGIKFALNFSSRRTVREELRVQAIWNGAMLQTEDIPTAISQGVLGKGTGKPTAGNGQLFASL